MNYFTRLFGFGFLTWVVPFVVSFAFFDVQTQQMTIDETFFKSIMIVTGGLVGTGLLVLFFKTVEKAYLIQGLIVGLSWLGINWALDLMMVWRGLFDMTYVEYFQEIGLRYLLILMYALGMGCVLQIKSSKIERSHFVKTSQSKQNLDGDQDDVSNEEE